MKVTMLANVAMLIAGTAAAEPSGDPFEGKLPPIRPDQTMSNDEVASYATQYLSAVASCYRTYAPNDRRPNGELALYVVIARNGKVVHSEVTAPGVPVLHRLPLERCLRRETATWQFPTRSGFTNATIPYVLLHTRTPGTGPWKTTSL